MYEIKITSVGQRPLEVVKEIKTSFGLGLRESKEIIDTVESEGFVILPPVLGAREIYGIVKGLRAKGATVEVIKETKGDADLLELEEKPVTEKIPKPQRIWVAAIHESNITVDLAHKYGNHAKMILFQLDISTINDKKIVKYDNSEDKKYNYMLFATSYEDAMSIAINKWDEIYLTNDN